MNEARKKKQTRTSPVSPSRCSRNLTSSMLFVLCTFPFLTLRAASLVHVLVLVATTSGNDRMHLRQLPWKRPPLPLPFFLLPMPLLLLPPFFPKPFALFSPLPFETFFLPKTFSPIDVHLCEEIMLESTLLCPDLCFFQHLEPRRRSTHQSLRAKTNWVTTHDQGKTQTPLDNRRGRKKSSAQGKANLIP